MTERPSSRRSTSACSSATARWARCCTRRASSSTELRRAEPDPAGSRRRGPPGVRPRRRRRHRDEHVRREPDQARLVRPRRQGCTRSTSQGAKIARHAARDQAYVAGAIGPLGIRIEPWGKTGVDEARGVLPRAGARRSLEGGVDLFILETFRDLNEIGAAIDAVRSVSRSADRRADDDRGGRQHASTARRRSDSRRSSSGAARTVIGLNCSVGPAPMLETIERMAHVATRQALGAAQRRPAARRRRAQHLSLLAGVHGVVRAALHQQRRAPRRRLLRDDAGAHPADQDGGARAWRRRSRSVRRAARSGRRKVAAAPAAPPVPREPRSRAWPTRSRAASSSSRRARAAARVPRRGARRTGAAAPHPRRRRS